jgi:hypothetical protein
MWPASNSNAIWYDQLLLRKLETHPRFCPAAHCETDGTKAKKHQHPGAGFRNRVYGVQIRSQCDGICSAACLVEYVEYDGVRSKQEITAGVQRDTRAVERFVARGNRVGDQYPVQQNGYDVVIGPQCADQPCGRQLRKRRDREYACEGKGGITWRIGRGRRVNILGTVHRCIVRRVVRTWYGRWNDSRCGDIRRQVCNRPAAVGVQRLRDLGGCGGSGRKGNCGEG